MFNRGLLLKGLFLFIAAALVACGGTGTAINDTAISSNATGSSVQAGSWSWQLPSGFPLPRVPTDNQITNEKVELGRHLFYDPKLSANGEKSCVSCHFPDRAFTDGRITSPGITGENTHRNAQGLINIVYSPTLTWANPSLTTLERQMEVPLFGTDPIELGLNSENLPTVLARFSSNPLYQKLFKAAFPSEENPFIAGNIVKAIASFQRSLISANSRYDQYIQGKAMLNAQEIRGLNLFNGEKAECFHCHTGFNFNDQTVMATSGSYIDIPFHNNGLYNIDGKGSYPFPNTGLEGVTGKAEDMGKFRAPSLRNVALTAPYNHDGSVASLEEVLQNYANGGRVIPTGLPNAGDGRVNPYKDDLIVKINLTPAEQADLIAFLKTLTDDSIATNPKFSNPFK